MIENNAGVGLVDVEAIGEKVMSATKKNSPEADILTQIRDWIRQGARLEPNGSEYILEEDAEGTWQTGFTVRPLKGKAFRKTLKSEYEMIE